MEFLCWYIENLFPVPIACFSNHAIVKLANTKNVTTRTEMIDVLSNSMILNFISDIKNLEEFNEKINTA